MPQDLRFYLRESSDKLALLQVNDGQTYFTFSEVFVLVEDLIKDVADAVANHAITRGSCKDMTPPMPLYEAYNHFALFLSDPTSLDRFRQHEDYDFTVAVEDGCAATSGLRVLGDQLQDRRFLQALDHSAKIEIDSLYQIHSSYAKLLQTYSLARVLCLLENQVTPMDQPACPMPASMNAYEKILPILRRLAFLRPQEGLLTMDWADFGRYWRNVVEEDYSDPLIAEYTIAGRQRDHHGINGSGNTTQTSLIFLRIQTLRAYQTEELSSFEMGELPPTSDSDNTDLDETSQFELKFLSERFITPEYMRNISSDWRRGIYSPVEVPVEVPVEEDGDLPQ
ncbi:MAG: hypothetical protein SEPTF4163_005399 [Sporothrix epigloea]